MPDTLTIIQATLLMGNAFLALAVIWFMAWAFLPWRGK